MKAAPPLFLFVLIVSACSSSEKKTMPNKQSDVSVIPSAPKIIPHQISPTLIPISPQKQKAEVPKPSSQNVAEVSATSENYFSSEIAAILANSTATEPPYVFWKDTEIAQFYEKNQKKSEYFEIKENKSFTIQAKEGTKIVIPEDAFVDANGNAPKYPLTLEIKEIYKFTDMVMNNLSTTCGDMILETGGMIYLQVTDNFQRELKINAGKELILEMPTKEKKDRMETFYGTRSSLTGVMNWRVANTNVSNNQGVYPTSWGKTNQILGQNSIKTYDIGEMQFSITDTKDLLGKERGQRIKILKVPGRLARHRYGMNEKLICQFQNKLGINQCYAGGLGINKVWLGANMHMNWADMVLVKEYFDVYHQKVQCYKVRVHAVVEQQKYILPNSRNFYSGGFDSLKWKKDIAFYDKTSKLIAEEGSEKIIEPVELRDKSQIINKETAEIATGNILSKYNYRIAVSNLGWTNCDQFQQSPLGQETLIVNNEGNKSVNFMLISHRSRTVLSGFALKNCFSFTQLMKGQKFQLVGIRYEQGKPEFAVMNIVAGDTYKIYDVPFQTMTYQELEQQLDGRY